MSPTWMAGQRERAAALRAALAVEIPGRALQPDMMDATLLSYSRAALAFVPSPTASERSWGAELHQAAIWGQSGMPTFRLTHGLEAQLLLTRCDAVLAREIAMPFGTFVVELPHPGGSLSLVRDGRPVPARWIVVHSVANLRVSPAASAQIVGEIFSADDPWEEADRRRLEVPLEPVVQVKVVGEDGYGPFYCAPALNEGAPWSSWARGLDDDVPPVDGDALEPLDRLAIRSAWRLIANLALYLRREQMGGRWSPSPTPRNAKRGDAREAPLAWTLGREVKLAANLRAAARDYAERGTDRARWELASRHLVRGHWRMQPCGPHGADRRPIHVEPYWRGDSSAAGVDRIYDCASRRGAGA